MLHLSPLPQTLPLLTNLVPEVQSFLKKLLNIDWVLKICTY